MSTPAWNDKFELSNALGSVSESDIQDYFQFFLKNHGENIDEPSVQVYVNKIENRITFKIKERYSLEFLTPETIKLLGSTENKIIKEKNGENVPHFEITEIVLVHFDIVSMITNKIREYYVPFFQINCMVVYQKFPQQIIFF